MLSIDLNIFFRSRQTCIDQALFEGKEDTSSFSICVPPSYEFVVTIIRQLIQSSSFRYGFLELLATRDNSSSQKPPSK